MAKSKDSTMKCVVFTQNHESTNLRQGVYASRLMLQSSIRDSCKTNPSTKPTKKPMAWHTRLVSLKLTMCNQRKANYHMSWQKRNHLHFIAKSWKAMLKSIKFHHQCVGKPPMSLLVRARYQWRSLRAAKVLHTRLRSESDPLLTFLTLFIKNYSV